MDINLLDALYQTWLDSFEEGSPTERVFRPSTFNFPPARGRYSFELKTDGRVVVTEIGPTDRRQEREGIWKLEYGDRLTFYLDSPWQPSQVLQIISVSPNQLVTER